MSLGGILALLVLICAVVLTLTAALPRGSGLLQSLMVIDRANQKAPQSILIFDSAPSGTYTDNGPCPTLGADAAKLVRKVNVLATDYETIGGSGVADLTAISKVLRSATTDLAICFGLLPD